MGRIASLTLTSNVLGSFIQGAKDIESRNKTLHSTPLVLYVKYNVMLKDDGSMDTNSNIVITEDKFSLKKLKEVHQGSENRP